MSYRGPNFIYRIRKTTVNNKTGDNFSITIPRIIAEQFSGCHFRLTFQNHQITFESGCKEGLDELNKQLQEEINKPSQIYIGNEPVVVFQ